MAEKKVKPKLAEQLSQSLLDAMQKVVAQNAELFELRRELSTAAHQLEVTRLIVNGEHAEAVRRFLAGAKPYEGVTQTTLRNTATWVAK